ncbi:hypothetical protein Tco_1319311, partial [Tanacetum coccineum]
MLSSIPESWYRIRTVVTAGASTAEKSIVVLQGLLDSSTLAAEVGVTAAASVPFVTSSVTPTPEREGGGHGDSIIGLNLRTQFASERFVVLTDSSHHSSTHATDDEVTSIVRSSMPPPPVLTAVVATTIIADVNSAPVPRAGPSHPVGTELSINSFFVSQDVNSETLQQIYIPKWNVTNDSALDDPNICRGLKERDTEIVSLKAQLSLKEAEAAEAIRLCRKIATIEAIEAARIAELNGLKEQFAAPGLTNDLLSLKMSFGELTIKAASLVSEKDGIVSALESTCSRLRELVSGYELFEEQIEAVKDEQVKIMSDKVAGIDADLMEMALHLHEEFYPRFLTTIAGRRVSYCIGGVIGRAIDKGIQDGLAASIDHGRAGRGLAEVAAYNPVAEADYVSAVSALCDVDFPLLAQLASHKDASMSDLMDLLRLEGHAVETPKAVQLQPSPEQLMLPIHRSEDQVVIKETSLSFSLDVIHASVQRTQGDAAAHRSSL